MENSYEGHELPEGYQLCGCKNEDDRKCCGKAENEEGKRWCEDHERCREFHHGEKKCGCHLFKLLEWKEGTKWEHVADPGVKAPAVDDFHYVAFRCICVIKVR
jgi:hypothetical protein